MLEAPETVITALVRLLPGRVHLPGSHDYLEGLTIWNGAVSARPAAVVRPQSSDQVQAIVRFAREHGVPMTVRGGGYDWAGRALNDDGLVIELCQDVPTAGGPAPLLLQRQRPNWMPQHPLQPKNQPIIQIGSIVNAVLVGQPRSQNAAQPIRWHQPLVTGFWCFLL